MINRKLSVKEALFIGIIFLLLLGGHYASIVQGRRWVLTLVLFFGYYFLVYIIFLLSLPKIDSFIKALVGSIFIPILTIYIVLVVGRSLDSNILFVLARVFTNIIGTIIEIFRVYFEYAGWLASIAIFAIWYFQKVRIARIDWGEHSEPQQKQAK
ncbi:MAG: hypothetical protein LBL48_12240 [Azoarcus sp.]|jgi:hypothetical protein|nr:hypothetical protein [Azoarcus sp.]